MLNADISELATGVVLSQVSPDGEVITALANRASDLTEHKYSTTKKLLSAA